MYIDIYVYIYIIYMMLLGRMADPSDHRKEKDDHCQSLCSYLC